MFDSELAKVVIMGAVQGCTELLPVSSSGHLVLAKHFLGLNSPGVTLEVALHIGTLIAVLAYYLKRIISLTANLATGGREGRNYLLFIIVGSIPAGVIGLVLKHQIEGLGDSPRLVAIFIMITGLILLSLLVRKRHEKDLGFTNVILIGIAQAIAIAPGISRSGSTIVMARHLGIEPRKAAEFSFMLMLPAVGGACVLELLHHSAWKTMSVSPLNIGIGILVAAVTGYLSILLLIRLLARDNFWIFGLYCLAAGGVAFALMH